MASQPRISASFISATSVRVRILNWQEGETTNLYMAEGWYGVPEEIVREHPGAEYVIDGLDAEGVYKFVASFNNAPLELSLSVIAKQHGPPDIIIFEPVRETTVTVVQRTFPVSWGPDLNLDILEIAGFMTEYFHGNESLATGINRTL